LTKGTVSASAFFQVTNLDKAAESRELSREHIKNQFIYFLFPESDFARLPEDSPVRKIQWDWSGNLERQQIIPFFCSRLDRFSFSQTAPRPSLHRLSLRFQPCARASHP